MEQKAKRNGLINFLMLLLVGASGYAASRYGASLAGETAMAFVGIGLLVAAVSWFQTRLEERERLEKLEFEELSKTAASTALFNASETEVFPAQRSREQFERFFVPAFTVLVFLLQALGGFLLWRWLEKTIPGPIQHLEVTAALFAGFGLLLLLIGIFSTTIARLENLRLLRPGSSYLLLNAWVCFLVCGGIVLALLGFPKFDWYLARVLSAVLMLIGLETLINLILEIYRPRVKGKVERPVYESRLVSLLGQPQGLITTASQTLDYQFGFKVSETWFYRYFSRALAWLLWLQVGILLACTCVVFIDAGQQGLFERFGRPVDGRSVLGPGLHFKFPWPIDQVYRFPTEQIQTFNIGFEPEPGRAGDKTVLWTVNHNKEENFLVANRELSPLEYATNNLNDAAGKRPPPVSLLTVSIPVQYQITNLVAWAYNNEDPSTLLEHIANREVVRYLVNVDLQEIMSRRREDAANTLRDRIQAEADRHQMGANITFVGLQDIHPPTKVASDYEKVVAAIQTKEAAILSARADALKTNLAGAQAFKIECEAQSDRLRREVNARARAALFTNQLPAYYAAPSVYTHRTWLQAFARTTANVRKYALLATNTQDIIIMDLEDKLRPDILDSIAPPTPKTNSPAAK